MSFQTLSLTGSKPEQYAQLLQQARALLHGERDRIANAANLSALVYNALPGLNWAGFYFFDGTDRGHVFQRTQADLAQPGSGFRADIAQLGRGCTHCNDSRNALAIASRPC